MKKYLWTIFIISCVVWIGIDIWQLSNPPRKEYAFLHANVLYGKMAEKDTAEVSECFEKWVGYRANWNGKFYYIVRVANRDPFHDPMIRFSGNHSVRVWGKRFVPVFRAGSIEDKIEEGN